MARPNSAKTVYMTHPDRKGGDGEPERVPVVQSAFDGHWSKLGWKLAEAEPTSPTGTTKAKPKKDDAKQ